MKLTSCTSLPLVVFGLALGTGCSADEDRRGDDAATSDTFFDTATHEEEGSDSGLDNSDAPNDIATSTEECYSQLDVVFVLDVSNSMSEFFETLRDQIGAVWNEALGIDDEPHFGLVVFVDDYTVVRSTTYLSVEEAQADFEKWRTHATSLANNQTRPENQSTLYKNTDYPENTLDALYAGATEFEWRSSEDTLRVIIHATDDTFREGPSEFSSHLPAVHSYAETVDKLQAEKIRVASFAALLGGADGTTDVSAGLLADYHGQPSIPRATSAEAFNIDTILQSASLGDAISAFVVQESCESYSPI